MFNTWKRILAVDPGTKFTGLAGLVPPIMYPFPIGTLKHLSDGYPATIDDHKLISKLCAQYKFNFIVCGKSRRQNSSPIPPILNHMIHLLNIDASNVHFIDESFTSSLTTLSEHKDFDEHMMAAVHILTLYQSMHHSEERNSTISAASPDDFS